MFEADPVVSLCSDVSRTMSLFHPQQAYSWVPGIFVLDTLDELKSINTGYISVLIESDSGESIHLYAIFFF